MNRRTTQGNGGSADTLSNRIERRIAGVRLRILIVGAGIAGATLGALLRQRGETPALIERAAQSGDGGYMLGLMPLGGRVLNGLQLRPAYHDASVPVDRYALYDRNGRLNRSYPLAPLIERFGAWRGIERGTLLGLLREAAGAIEYGATVSAIAQTDDGAAVTFHDGSVATFDLVVGADGMHSDTRSLILTPDQVEWFDTGWGGFVVWSSLQGQETDTFRELWSTRWGIGLYRVKQRLGVFLAGRHKALAQRDVESYAGDIESLVPPGPFARALQNRERSALAFYWRMVDCRARRWWRGRTVLLGDAAFLPTAGVGASAAMDSAAALADEMSRADPAHMKHALDLFEKRQRRRVERAQRNSRKLARYMFVNSAPAAWLRDRAMHWYTLEMLVRDISRVMSGDQ